MAHIKGEDVRGYYDDEGRMFCTRCAKGLDLGKLEQKDVITGGDLNDDDFYFCDECGEQL